MVQLVVNGARPQNVVPEFRPRHALYASSGRRVRDRILIDPDAESVGRHIDTEKPKRIGVPLGMNDRKEPGQKNPPKCPSCLFQRSVKGRRFHA